MKKKKNPQRTLCNSLVYNSVFKSTYVYRNKLLLITIIWYFVLLLNTCTVMRDFKYTVI